MKNRNILSAWAAVLLAIAAATAAPARADPQITDVVADKALHVRDAIKRADYAAAHAVMAGVLADSKIENWRFYPFADVMTDLFLDTDTALPERLDEWIAAQKDDAIPLLLRAEYFYTTGWSVRGHNFADRTSPRRRVSFQDYMQKAYADIDAAIALDGNNPYAFYMRLQIMRGYGISPEMQEMFKESIVRYPDYVPLYEVLLSALEPRWGGSVKEMYAFVDQHAGGAPAYSPRKMLYLTLYYDLFSSSYADCDANRGDHDRMARCISIDMGRLVSAGLQRNVSAALDVYNHSDHYQAGLAIKDKLFAMLSWPDGDAFSGAILETAANAMHSDTQLTEEKPGHNDYIIDQAVAISWTTKGFYDNALAKYTEALADAASTRFPSEDEEHRAIGSIYEDLADIAGNKLHRYEDMITYERAAIAHGVFRNEHYICYANHALKQYDAAIQACTDAIDRSGSLYARFWRAVSYRDAGNKDAALTDFTQVAESENRFAASAVISLSMIYFDRKDNSGALDILTKYDFVYDPNRVGKQDVAVAYNNRCYAYMQLGDLHKALDDCSASLRYGSLPDAIRKRQQLLKSLGQ